jgi:hypothetical protein
MGLGQAETGTLAVPRGTGRGTQNTPAGANSASFDADRAFQVLSEEVDRPTVRSQTPSAEPMVCTPMHSRRLLGEEGENVRVATEPVPDGVRSTDAPIGRALRLALIGQATALPAFEQLVEAIKDRNPASAGAAEPRTPAAERASRPGQRDPLSDVFPVGRAAQPKAIHQDDRIKLGPEVDQTGWFAITGPSQSPRRPRLQHVLPLHNPRWRPLTGQAALKLGSTWNRRGGSRTSRPSRARVVRLGKF